MIQLTLDKADEHLKLETPKEYAQQLAACSEALRRARTRGGAGGMNELEELRALLEGREVTTNGRA